MAQDDAQAARPDAQPPSPPPRPRYGTGFLIGLVGGLVGAFGTVYALQFPQVRNALPMPEQAALIVNPEAVARIGALEQELTQLRNFAREADTRQGLGALTARVDTLSNEVTEAATAAQLAELRNDLSPLAMPEGAEALEARIDALAADLGTLGESAARASALATVEAAVQGFERRVGALEETAPTLRDDVDELAAELAAAKENVAAIAAALAAGEAALAERSAALGGRIDASARDVGEVQSAVGAAGARIDALAEQVAALTAQAATASSAAEAAGARSAQTAEAVATFTAEVDRRMADLVAEFGALDAALEERVAALASEAAAAVTSAEAARTEVERSLQRTRAAGQIGIAARGLEQALATGSELRPASETLAAVETDAIEGEQAERVASLRATIDGHVEGVASLPALRASLANLRPAVERAVAPPAEDGIGSTLLDTLQLRASGRAGAAGEVLDRMRDHLDDDDVRGAVQAASALPEAGREVLSDWLVAARAHVAVDEARRALLDLGRDVTASAAGAS